MKFTSTDERKPHPSYYTTFNNYNSTSAPTLLRAMDSDSDESIRHVRPPSSYGSMKSDGDEKKEDEEEEEEDSDSDSDSPFTGNVLFVPTAAPSGLQLNRSNYPETLHTQTTQETKPQDAYCIIDTKSEEEPELQQWEDVEVEEEDFYRLNSPEPPPPVEDGEPMEEESQAERLHPELAMPHVFKNIHAILTRLSLEDLANFKAHLFREEIRFNLQEMLQWDSLDLVDKMIEVLGHEKALKLSINGLESIRNETQAQVLKDTCKRVMLRIQLKKHILRRFKVLYEGVPRPGKQQPLDTIYVQPEISRRGPRAAAIDPASDDMGGDSSGFIDVKDLLRLCRASGELVKTLVTTGVPGIGLSVVAARFFMDWAEGVANKDIQFVIPLSFESLWSLQKTQPPPTEKMSIMAVIGHYYKGFEDVTYLEEQDCRFLILMDSFDCYLNALDWKTRVVSDSRAPENLDVLIVNLIRGNLLPSACLWILGRQGAISNIPPELIDAVTDVHGFSDVMKDVYLCRRLEDPELSRNIVSHYKGTPTLETLCRQPFVCWLAATTFQRCYRYQGYGAHPPRLTPFYVHVMVIQTNRKLQRYRGQAENHLKWSSKDVNTLLRLGKMALALVKRQAWVFSQEDLRKHDLEDVQEITVYSGLCTELPLQDTFGKKQFRFIHNTFQEFMAAVYVFTLFHLEGRNALKEPSRGPQSPLPKLGRAGLSGAAGPTRSANDLLRGALQSAKQGSPRLDLVLRFLCGMVAPGNHNDVLRGKLLQAAAPRLTGLEAARDLLAREAEQATEAEWRANLQECLRELVQEDE